MHPTQLSELAQHFASLPTETLVKAATLERSDYEPEAIALIDKELVARNVSLLLIRELKEKFELERVATEQKLYGIRGWLLVFVTVIAARTAYAAMWVFITLVSDIRDETLLLRSPLILFACYGCVVFALLSTKNPTAPAHTSWLIMSWLIYQVLMAGLYYFEHRPAAIIFGQLSAVIATLGLLSYLHQSRRVAVTYGNRPAAKPRTLELPPIELTPSVARLSMRKVCRTLNGLVVIVAAAALVYLLLNPPQRTGKRFELFRGMVSYAETDYSLWIGKIFSVIVVGGVAWYFTRERLYAFHDSASAPTASRPSINPPARDFVRRPRFGVPASFGIRCLAHIIDSIIIYILALIASDLTGYILSLNAIKSSDAIVLYRGFAALVSSWLYYGFTESSSKQASFGKLVCGLIVTDLQGQRLHFGQASGRFFGMILSTLTLCVGFIMCIWTEKKQCLHDIMARCLVLRK